MTARSRRRRPAPGRQVFAFLLGWMPIVEPSPAPPAPAPPPPLPAGWWRRRRAGAPTPSTARSETRDARTIGRWLRRGAACVLCRSPLHPWPAPEAHHVGRRLVLLVCPACSVLPSTPDRLLELDAVDWRPESIP
jgi:hypothetical protein